MAFGGGWIDQPFVSRLNPPERLDGGRRPGANQLVHGTLRDGDRHAQRGPATLARWASGSRPGRLVARVICRGESGQSEPSGSQDMIGLIYPGVNRLDYDFAHEGGVFPRHIESNNDPASPAGWKRSSTCCPWRRGRTATTRWDQEPRPGMDSSTGRHGPGVLRRHRRLRCAGPGGRDERLHGVLGNHSPAHRAHPTVTADLKGLLAYYQSRYCGGDLFRLRRRILVRCFRPARARPVEDQRPDRGIMRILTVAVSVAGTRVVSFEDPADRARRNLRRSPAGAGRAARTSRPAGRG